MRLLRTLGGTRSWRMALVVLLIIRLQASVAGVGQQVPPSAPTGVRPKHRPTLAERVGIGRVVKRDGHRAPRGRGVKVGHVEGSIGHYLPKVGESLSALVLTPASGPSGSNAHTTMTARVIYGKRGLAPGVPAVDFYASSHWLSRGYLQAASPNPPGVTDCRLFNHSWVGERADVEVMDVLSRIDYVIDNDDVVMVVGVNNGRTSRVPALLASAYNVIAVGQIHGDSSGGYTRIEGAGRCKPDIVAPGRQTSRATPVVTAVVARLLEAADRMPELASVKRTLLTKAVLLAGAAKPKHWAPAPGKPLDEHLGAGRVRFDLSEAILRGGPYVPEHRFQRYGWDAGALAHDGQRIYRFDLARSSGRLSVVLVWHRRIVGPPHRAGSGPATDRAAWSTAVRLANFDVRLVREDRISRERVVAQSTSCVDNLEHLYLRQVPEGRYRIEIVRRDRFEEPWEYVLAWRIGKTL